MGPRAGLDRQKISPHQDSIPGLSSPVAQSLYLLSYPALPFTLSPAKITKKKKFLVTSVEITSQALFMRQKRAPDVEAMPAHLSLMYQ